MRFLNRITIARGRNDNAGHLASLCGYGRCQLPAGEGGRGGTCEIKKGSRSLLPFYMLSYRNVGPPG